MRPRTLLITILASLFFSSCNVTEDSARQVTTNESKPVTTHALEPAFTTGQTEAIGQAKHMFQIFPVDRVVRLRHSGDVIVGMVDQVTLSTNYIFVLDKEQRTIFRFDHEGTYQGTLGNVGGGPGEFEAPTRIKTVWDQNVAVLDRMGRLLLFNEDGEHIHTLFEGKGIKLPSVVFEWPTPDRLYSVGYRGVNEKDFVQVYDCSDLEKPKLISSFDKREPFLKEFGFRRAYKAFTFIEGQVWSANPYQGSIQVWDPKGNPKKTIRLGREMIDYPYLREMAEKHPGQFVLDREAILELHYASGAIISDSTKGFQILDRTGKQLSKVMPRTCRIIGTHQGQIITLIDGGEREINRQVLTSGMQAEYKLMVDLGYNLEEGEDEYYLRFGSLIEP